MSCFFPRLQTPIDLQHESLYLTESTSYSEIVPTFYKLPSRTLLDLTIQICCKADDRKLYRTLKKIQKLVLSRFQLNTLNLQGNFEQYPHNHLSSVRKLIGEASILQCGNRAGTFLVNELPHLSFKAAFITCPGFFILSAHSFSLLANDIDTPREIQLVRLVQKHWGFKQLSQVTLLPTSHALEWVLETLSAGPIQTLTITDQLLTTFEKLKLPQLAALSVLYTTTELALPSLKNLPKLSSLSLDLSTRDHHARHKLRAQVADWVAGLDSHLLHQLHKFGSAEYRTLFGHIDTQHEANDLLAHPRSVNHWARCLALDPSCEDSSETTSENSDVL